MLFKFVKRMRDLLGVFIFSVIHLSIFVGYLSCHPCPAREVIVYYLIPYHAYLYTGLNNMQCHVGILGIGMELACNGGSRGGISLKRD